LAGYTASLAALQVGGNLFGRPKPAGVVIWTDFGVNILFGDSAGEDKAATQVSIY
jgi:hypothetical protein